MFLKAFKFAYLYHNGQFRKQSRVPYIVHPARVASYFNDDEMKTIAMLHDIIEDTDCSIQLLQQLFPLRITEVVDILSKREEETHFEYIKRVKKNEKATAIKIADIIDNLSDTITVCSESMCKRYDESLKILLS
jgi:(p)ppGpp synthase/HD superfamily hydrolase